MRTVIAPTLAIAVLTILAGCSAAPVAADPSHLPGTGPVATSRATPTPTETDAGVDFGERVVNDRGNLVVACARQHLNRALRGAVECAQLLERSPLAVQHLSDATRRPPEPRGPSARSQELRFVKADRAIARSRPAADA